MNLYEKVVLTVIAVQFTALLIIMAAIAAKVETILDYARAGV